MSPMLLTSIIMIFELQFFKNVVINLDNLRVDDRPALADNFETQLPKLPKPPRLRLFIAEKRAVVPKLDRLRPIRHPVLQIRPHDRRRPLRPQR